MKRVIPLLMLLVLLPQPSPAASGEAQAKLLAPLLEETTFGLVRLDLSKVDAEALAKMIKKYLAPRERDLMSMTADIKRVQKMWKDLGIKQLYIILSLASILEEEVPRVVVEFADAASAKKADPALERFPLFQEFQFIPRGNVLVGGDKNSLKRLKEDKPLPQPELAKALDGVEGPVSMVVYTASKLFRKSLEELAPELPPALGGGSVKTVTRGLKWGVVTLKAPPEVKLNLTFQASSPEMAKSLQKIFSAGLKIAARNKEVARVIPDLRKLSAKLIPQVKGARLMLGLQEKDVADALMQIGKAMRGAAGQARTMNTMKQLGLAMHNYHDTYGNFPAAFMTAKKKKKPLLSWRVHILPFVEQIDLYKQFKLDEPWDSPHNKKLIKKMPPVYASDGHPDLAKEGKTTFVVPIHEKSIFPGIKGLRIQEITDGTSNTIMTLEVEPARAVTWTQPIDHKIDPKKPAAGLRLYEEKAFPAGLADGSVRMINLNIMKAVLWALFTRNGGEVIPNID